MGRSRSCSGPAIAMMTGMIREMNTLAKQNRRDATGSKGRSTLWDKGWLDRRKRDARVIKVRSHKTKVNKVR